ncbi:MAG TPA: hypothetical protein VKV34_08780, partial [Thermoleophilia bacterium]|nr:hypothetical protein [Thermoleophilia bacterium]
MEHGKQALPAGAEIEPVGVGELEENREIADDLSRRPARVSEGIPGAGWPDPGGVGVPLRPVFERDLPFVYQHGLEDDRADHHRHNVEIPQYSSVCFDLSDVGRRTPDLG